MEHLVKLLFLLAAINILSSLTATLFDVERSAWTPAYINTHYITCAIGFTAWAHAAMATGDYFSEVFTFVMTVFGLAVSAAAFVADLGNIPVIRKLKATIPLHRMMKNLSTTEDMKPWLEATFNLQKQQFLTIYAILDGLTAFLAIPVCCLLLKKLLQSRFNMNRQATNVPLLGLGTALIVVAVLRGVIYISEIMTLRASPFVAVSFINYTIDEPAWIGVSVATGVLIVLSSRGSYLLRGVSLVSCGLLVWPAMFFMWIDYRALDTGLNRTMSPFSLSPMVSIVLAFMELGVLIATSLTLLQQFPTGSKVQLDVSVHRVFIGISIALLVIGFMTLSLDLYSAYEQVFYRLFHGSEQKLPFLCFILSIICYICPNPTFAGAGLPLCLAMAILTINSTLFQIIAYLYLSYNNYMSEVICPLLQPKSCGTGADPITTEGTRLHLLETLLNFTVLILCSCICVLVTRIGRMRRVTERPEVTPAERDQVKRGERYILCLGVTMELQALLLFGVVLLSNMRNVDHPLIIMYGYLYHIALALALVIFSLYQIIVSEGLFEQPLAQNTLLTLTVARFVSTLTQLDYRNTGDGMDIEWRLHHLIDLFSLIFLFWTALITLGFGRLGKQSILDADEINLDFNNPLEESFNAAQDSGYVQLRPELDL